MRHELIKHIVNEIFFDMLDKLDLEELTDGELENDIRKSFYTIIEEGFKQYDILKEKGV